MCYINLRKVRLLCAKLRFSGEITNFLRWNCKVHLSFVVYFRLLVSPQWIGDGSATKPSTTCGRRQKIREAQEYLSSCASRKSYLCLAVKAYHLAVPKLRSTKSVSMALGVKRPLRLARKRSTKRSASPSRRNSLPRLTNVG